MTLFDYFDSQIPDYYDTMYMDGYSPERILYAAHKSLMKRIEAQREAANKVDEIKITTEIKRR